MSVHPQPSYEAPDRGVRNAAAALSTGGPVVLVNDSGRRATGVLLLVAESVTARQIAFAVRHTTGILCAPMAEEYMRALDLRSEDSVTVSVDHVTTEAGASAEDRAATFRALADPRTTPGDLRRRGHVFPVEGVRGGVLQRATYADAAIELLEMAGQRPVGVTAELVAQDGSLMNGAELEPFAESRGMVLLTISELQRHRFVLGQRGTGVAGVMFGACTHSLTRAV